MKSTYLDLIALVERLHRQFLEVVKLELDTNAVHDINNVQAMILYNIGDLEMTVGELTLRGCYLGSNVSYNVKKMLGNGYIVQERSSHDRRSVRVRLSEKGLALYQKLKRMHERHMASLAQGVVQGEDMVATAHTLRRLERFLIHLAEVSGPRSSIFQGAWGNGMSVMAALAPDRDRAPAAARD
jgi:DNA-binding MarR family transcriptional regulator